MKIVLILVALIVMTPDSLATSNDKINLGTLHSNEAHDGCGTELWLQGMDAAGPEVFDYLDTRRGEVAHIRVNGRFHALRFVGLNPEESWKDDGITVILRTRAATTGEDAAKLRGTMTIIFRRNRRTYRVHGWVGC